MRPKYLEIILTGALLVVVASGFATTWTRTSATNQPVSIGMSADGRIVLALPSTTVCTPAISTNWGQTWVNLTNVPPQGTLHQRNVAMSADGTKIIAALSTTNHSQPGSVFITTNSGATWMQTDLMNSNTFQKFVIACSADATKVIAGVSGNPSTGIYFSTNAGVNWYHSSAPNTNWTSVASSADGQRMAAIVNGGQLYFSIDFGATWTPANLPAQSWNSVCLSSDGRWVGATSTNTYISSDAGTSWTTNRLVGEVIACSANGTSWIIGGGPAFSSPVYMSIDGGVTWVTNDLENYSYWTDGAVSADGCRFMAVDGDGQRMWAGTITPSPQLTIQPTNGNLAVSWLVPSTNFVLQQNSDLSTANWATISNSPILNLTNLQDQVSVPASASNGFFRLIAQ